MCSLRIASRLLFFFHRCRPERRIPAAQRAPSRREELCALPVLIVSLSYCSAVSVLLNPRLVDLEHLANKATRRISLVKLLCATSCRCSLSVGSATLGSVPESTRRAIGIGDRRSTVVSLAFKSIQRRSRLSRSQQCDPDSGNRSSRRSTDRHSQEPSSFFTRHCLEVVPFVARRYSSTQKRCHRLYQRSISAFSRRQ